MCMVELPPELAIADTPGVPGAGVRQQLRERFKIEAAVANFGAPPTRAVPISENARGPKGGLWHFCSGLERKFPELEKEIALSAKLGCSLAGVS